MKIGIFIRSGGDYGLQAYGEGYGVYGGPYNGSGLLGNGLHTVRVLTKLGIPAELINVSGYQDLVLAIKNDSALTHVIIEAIWVTAVEIQALTRLFPNIIFVVRAHSKAGFLQVEPQAIKIMRDLADLHLPKFLLAANNPDFANDFRLAYGNCIALDNLYDLGPRPILKTLDKTRPLRVCSFGASRLLKMHATAALAAVLLAKSLNMKLEFHINVDRTPGGDSVRQAVKYLIQDKGNLIQDPWQDPDSFGTLIGTMDLSFNLSATESFCLVAADAVSQGVPVISTSAISWLLPSVKDDDAGTAADSASNILLFPNYLQWNALSTFCSTAQKVWNVFLQFKGLN